MSRSNRDNVYCQASFSKEAWLLAVKIMDLFEEKSRGRNSPPSSWHPNQNSNSSICSQYSAFLTDSNHEFLHLLLRKTCHSVSLRELAVILSRASSSKSILQVYKHLMGGCPPSKSHIHYSSSAIPRSQFQQANAPGICCVLPSSNACWKLCRANCPGGCAHPPWCACICAITLTLTIPEGPLNLSNIAIICEVVQTSIVKDAVQHCYDHLEVAYWHNSAAPAAG